MILRFHILTNQDIFFTDKAIEGFIGQKTKVAGCPAIIKTAHRCPGDDNAIDIAVSINNAFDSYIEYVKLFKQNELEGISLTKED